MNRHTLSKSAVLAAIAAAFFVSGCGNPFGAGEASYKIFANLGKAIAKPSQINDEQGSKSDTKATIAQAQAMAGRLCKSAAGTVDTAYVTGHGLDTLGNGLYRYWEEVAGKPSEEDPEKLMTGRGMITFGYNGVPSLSALDTTKIVSINSFAFTGYENKTWRSVIDSIWLTITFRDNSWTDRTLTPGIITARGKNVSALTINGKGDTAFFTLDSLNETTHIQYGEGHFFDMHTGRLHDGDSRSFDFTLQVLHQNLQDPSKPYLRYQDNEGTINFALAREGTDSLFFSIRFYEVHKREGTIRKNSANGIVVAKFTYNEKDMRGTATYYDDDGKEIGTEDL